MKKNYGFGLLYLPLALFGIFLLQDFWTNSRKTESVPFNEFEQLLDQKKIKEVVVSDNHLKATLKEPLKNGKTKIITVKVEPKLAAKLAASGVVYKRVVESTLIRTILSWIFPIAIIVAIWFFMMRRMGQGGAGGGGMMSIGKSKAKVYMETDIKVSFNDVAGVDEASEELIEIVNFLKKPADFGRLGARIPKGVLLVGPPGTGKTLLARAIAGEAKVPFFSISGSEFVEMFVGVGAARVRDLFEQARAKEPCIIFIDELDALGKSRGQGQYGGGHDEKEQTLNQLLVEMDGFDATTGVVLIAATNRPEILDPALLRAGRFDRQILVDRPDKSGRLEILGVHSKKIKMGGDVELENIAAITPGFSGADLENLVNEAALVATRENAKFVSGRHFTMAVERIVAGLEKKSRILNEKERRTVAHHEMGHALVAAALPDTDPVHKVSIIPRGVGALGYTLQRPTEDRFIMTRDELKNRMRVLLGGRAAETIIFDHLSTGASDDINKATDIARGMVTRYGMDPELGNVAYESNESTFLGGQPIKAPKEYSEESARRIDHAVRELVDGALKDAIRILELNRPLLESSANMLLEKEKLDEVELKQFFEGLNREALV